MLYDSLSKIKQRKGLTEDLKKKIDILFVAGRLTEDDYMDLMDIPKEETTDEVIDVPVEETVEEVVN